MWKHRAVGSQPFEEMFEDVELELSDGAKVDVELNSIPSTQVLEWNDVALATPVLPALVTITAKSVYGAINGGFPAVRVLQGEGQILIVNCLLNII